MYSFQDNFGILDKICLHSCILLLNNNVISKAPLLEIIMKFREMSTGMLLDSLSFIMQSILLMSIG